MKKSVILPAFTLLLLSVLQAAFATDPKAGFFKAALPTTASEQGRFKLVKRQNSITLYERWVPHNGSEVRELKAEFTIRSGNAEKLQLLLKNESKGLQWNNNASKYQVIPGESENSWLVYILYDAPWPVHDFDCVLAYRVDRPRSRGHLTEISFKSAESSNFPVSEKITRITGTRGKWTLENRGDSLNVTYRVTTDRSRKVPRWVSDPIVHENLFKTMTGFKNLLEE